MVQSMTMRARRLIDPMNSHEFVEVEVTYIPEFTAQEPKADEVSRVNRTAVQEPASITTEKCAAALQYALNYAKTAMDK